jgi:DNA recombination-dependent growth factor C
MPIATGSFAIKRFQILSPAKEISFPWILERVQKSFISPINLDDTREETLGFCHPFSGEPKIDNPHSLIYENIFLFGLREDKKKIPATYMKLQLRAALEALGHEREDSQGTVKKVGKKIRESVKDRLKEELLRSTLPSVKLIEILWHLNTNQIWLTSASPSVVAEFEKLFFDAFSLPFISINPGTASMDFESIQLGLKVNIQPYLDVSPVSLATSETRKNSNYKLNEDEIPLF